MRDVKKVKYMLATGSLNRVYVNNDGVVKRIIKSAMKSFRINRKGLI